MDRATKKRLIKACKIDEPVPPGDPRHFDFDAPALELRGRPWRTQVADVIELSDEPTTQLVSGLPGSGKSTELRQLKEDLTASVHEVVLADAGAWIRDDQPIGVSDILLALVLALYPDGEPDGMSGWLRDYAEQAKNFLLSEAKITQLSGSAGGLSLKAELTTNNTIFQTAARHLAELQSLREQVFKLLDVAGRAAESNGEPLVIILDGIEKRSTGDLSGPEERERYRNHWFGAFLTHARDLRPPVHVVYTVPPFMVRRSAELGHQFGQELQFLPMVKIFYRDEDQQGRAKLHAPGVCAMRDALFLRVPRTHFSSPAVACWLAIHSGGYMRDLLRMVIACIYRVPSGGVITKEIADEAIVRIRQTYLEGLRGDDERLLSMVHTERQFPLNEQNQSRMDSLLQSYMMLRYHNSDYWYDAHPLVFPRIGAKLPSFEEVGELCQGSTH